MITLPMLFPIAIGVAAFFRWAYLVWRDWATEYDEVQS